MQKGGQMLDANSRASRVIKVFLVQRPTKTLLTFGTHLYDEHGLGTLDVLTKIIYICLSDHQKYGILLNSC